METEAIVAEQIPLEVEGVVLHPERFATRPSCRAVLTAAPAAAGTMF